MRSRDARANLKAMVTSKTTQSQRSRDPLNEADTEKQTIGCRHGNPDLCVKNRMPSVCALARADRICLAPPRGWPKNYKRLAEFRDDMK
jgi:hypothetical protein